MSITSIIPSIIFGIVLIIGWFPVIVLTEKNNKGNDDEYKLLLSKIDSDLKLTDVTDKMLIRVPTDTDREPIYFFDITNEFMTKYNNNIHVTVNKNTKTTDSNGKTTTNTVLNADSINRNIPLINGVVMDTNDYVYLAEQNKVFTTTTTDSTDSNVTYDLTFYSIPRDKSIMQVEGLQKFETDLDMTIYNYEFGPTNIAKKAIKDRKLTSDKLQMWLGRIGTFLMLFIGLSLLISPLTFLNQLGDALPGPLKLLAIPGKIIATIYETFSFFGSLLLTILMTFLVWSIINHPIISVFIGGMIVGLLLYFHKK